MLGDLILMAVVLATAFLMFVLPMLSGRSQNAEIVFAGTGETRTVSLLKNASFEVRSNGVSLTVCVEDGKIFVSDSDCRDGICSSSPPVSYAGQSIVCAPAGIIIRVTGEEVLVDGVSG